jgi:hypothetical protein
MAIIDALPSTQTRLVGHLIATRVKNLTTQDYLQIVEQSVNDFQCESTGHSSLFLGESVQSLEDSLDVALSE